MLQLSVRVGIEQISFPNLLLFPWRVNPGRWEWQGCSGFPTLVHPRTWRCAAECTFPSVKMNPEWTNSNVVCYLFLQLLGSIFRASCILAQIQWWVFSTCWILSLHESVAPLGYSVEPNKPYPESYLSMSWCWEHWQSDWRVCALHAEPCAKTACCKIYILSSVQAHSEPTKKKGWGKAHRIIINCLAANTQETLAFLRAKSEKPSLLWEKLWLW